MAEPLLLVDAPLAQEAVDRFVRAGLGPAVRVLGTEVLSISPGHMVLGLDLLGGERVVLKTRRDDEQPSFDVEAHQLEQLALKSPLRVPRALVHGKGGAAGPRAFLLLERIEGLPWARVRPSLPSAEAAALEWRFGALLGRMHRECVGEAFAEVLPRSAPSYRSWPEFFSRLWQQRMDALLRTDRLETHVLDAVAWIHSNLEKLVATDEAPRLIHGNLGPTKVLLQETGGASSAVGIAGFLDPSLAYAHRELDLALLELSDAVDESFFEGYESEIPIDDGYEDRKPIYMLYGALERVRLAGATHDILSVMDLVRRIVRRSGWH